MRQYPLGRLTDDYRNEKKRPLILIGHGIGGILIIQVRQYTTLTRRLNQVFKRRVPPPALSIDLWT
jgi:hypothetical protein